MTDQEIIAKAKKALDAMKIGYEKDATSVRYHDNLSSLFNMLELNKKKDRIWNLNISITF
ncbi:MAG TPA: hypothetical protein PLF48_04930 [Chitinophagales bacterium]|nr:hypothetical protein [Chitinophagales bacterium]